MPDTQSLTSALDALTPEDKERFLTLGMDHYLSKPIIADQLRAVLNHVGALLPASRSTD